MMARMEHKGVEERRVESAGRSPQFEKKLPPSFDKLLKLDSLRFLGADEERGSR
jgi:hypothetical protein